jgi:hypothetical protein
MLAKNSFFFFILFLTLIACKAPASKSTPDLASIAKIKLGPYYTVVNNDANTHALYYESPNGNQHISKKLRFIVINLGNSQIVAEDFFVLNNIKWLNNSQIEYLKSNTPTGNKSEPTKKIVNVTLPNN